MWQSQNSTPALISKRKPQALLLDPVRLSVDGIRDGAPWHSLQRAGWGLLVARGHEGYICDYGYHLQARDSGGFLAPGSPASQDCSTP